VKFLSVCTDCSFTGVSSTVHTNDANDDGGDNDKSSVQFLYISACQQRVAYNRRAMEVHITEAKLRLEV
jgi:hypothetical protein